MAIPVVESSTKATTTADVSSITITKPTGLALGDLLIACIATYDGDNRTHTTPAGWSVGTQTTSQLVKTTIFYKEAESADVSASNFTFNMSANTGFISGVLVRITGHVPVTPITVGESDAANVSAQSSYSPTTSITPDTEENSILLMSFALLASAPGGTPTMGSYASTPSATWTEIQDAGLATTAGMAHGVAYAEYDTDTEVTSRSATQSSSGNYQASSIVVIRGSIDKNTIPTFVSSTQTVFTPTGIADTAITLPLVASTQSKFDPGGKATSPTQWTNEADTDTTWTNEASL